MQKLFYKIVDMYNFQKKISKHTNRHDEDFIHFKLKYEELQEAYEKLDKQLTEFLYKLKFLDGIQ